MLDMAVITHNGKPMSCVDQLHWLDVPDRVLFKLAVTVHQCLNGRAPPYLSEHCIPVSSVDTRRRLRSANRHLLADRVSGSTLMGLLQLRYEHDSTTIRLQHATRCVRFDYDSSAIQHPTRNYVLSSNNEHVNSFQLL